MFKPESYHLVCDYYRLYGVYTTEKLGMVPFKKAVRTRYFWPLTRMLFCYGSNKKWPKNQVRKVVFTVHLLWECGAAVYHA